MNPQSGGITKMIIKMGLAKNEAGANTVMIIVAVVMILLSIYLWSPSGFTSKGEDLTLPIPESDEIIQ